MPGLCAGRIVAITGAGRGIGKEHAKLFAKEGAKVVVNDVDPDVCAETVAELKASGAEAVAHTQDCSTWEGGNSLIQTAIDTFGGFDTLVNNAGILRDKTTINMTEADWDAIMKVHLKGTFVPTNAALQYWRKCAQENKPRKGRIINTSSVSGLYGNFGQSNYAAAKAGLAAFTIVTNAEVERMGIRVNCLTPNARTRMTLPLGGVMAKEIAPDKFDPFHPRNMSPVVVWFGSDACEIGGCVILINGRSLSSMEGWRPGKTATKEGGADVMWDPSELTNVIPKIYNESEKHMMYKNLEAAAAAKARAKAKL